MGRYEGGYIGARPTWNDFHRSGIWTPQSVFHRQKLGLWTPKDPFFWNVVLYLKGDGESTNIIDSSPNPKTISRFGNAVISTAQSKYGGSSIYFAGGGYLSIPNSTDFAFNSDFTIEFYLNTNVVDSNWTRGIIANTLVNSGSGIGIGIFAQQLSVARNGAQSPSLGTITGNIWRHIAVSQQSSFFRVFINGVLVSTLSAVITNPTEPLIIGNFSPIDSNRYFVGFIDSLRITKGVARYTDDFDPEIDTYLAY